MTEPQADTTLPTRKAGWFARPVLSLLLGVSWLALSHSLELVHIVSAVLIGLVVPRLLRPFLAPTDSIDWLAALRLSGVVLKDIVLSNITVARLVLGPMERLQPAWLPVPLACTIHASMHCSPPSSPPRQARCRAWSTSSATRSWCTRSTAMTLRP